MLRRVYRSCALWGALAVLAGGGLAAVPALAAGNQIINDCQTHGRLTASYAVGALRQALHTLPASVKEYTDCYDVINQALLAATGHRRTGGSTGGGSGGAFLPTPVIIVLVVLILAAVTLGALALRRRRADVNRGGHDPATAPGTTRLFPQPQDPGEDG